MNKKDRVLVAMSGGVDSSVASLFLKEEGYEVIGVTFRTWDYISEGCYEKQKGCCSIESIIEAKQFADKFGIPHHVLDLRKYFEKTVIKKFVSEYLSGRTPNPCVQCNAEIKWGEVVTFADKMECKFVATGHYAQVRKENNRYILSRGTDETKDQSYFLWMLTQENLLRTIFPLGKWKKNEIKKFIADRGLIKLSEKRESQEICFIPKNDYRKFLKEQIPDIDDKIGSGDFVLTNGKIIGRHKGYPFYTIGQRKGLVVAVGHPLYVVNINPKTNTVILGTKEELTKTAMTVHNFNLIKYADIPNKMEVITKVRYKDNGSISVINQLNEHIQVDFKENVSAIAPGQSAVFYEHDDVVGGGIIQ